MLRNPPRTMGCDLKEGECGIVPEDMMVALLACGTAERVIPPDPEDVAAKPVKATADQLPKSTNRLQRKSSESPEA